MSVSVGLSSWRVNPSSLYHGSASNSLCHRIGVRSRIGEPEPEPELEPVPEPEQEPEPELELEPEPEPEPERCR